LKNGGTVVGNDDHVYGIPFAATCIVKFDPTNPDITSTVGEELERVFVRGAVFYCTNGVLAAEVRFKCGNGVLGCDGYIYAANGAGQVLQIDAARNNYTWLGDQIDSDEEVGWDGPIIARDHWDGVTLLLELISASTGLHTMPIVYSNLTLRHNNCHHSWGMTWVEDLRNGRVEL